LIVSVAEAAQRLRRGEVVAYPTETVYGLGADALSIEAVERLRSLKGRDAEQGLSVLVSDLADLERWAADLPGRARRLARAFWPGPLTLVVPVPAGRLPAVGTALGVGFRCSPHPTAAALAAAFGAPLVSTSANRSGEAPARSAREVSRSFGPELAIAGGEDAGGAAASTVVAVDREGRLRVLREGPIPAESLRRVE
jgi:L-threonylcarbamoyladenylate synthase